MAANQQIGMGAQSASAVYTQLMEKGVTATEAGLITSQWIAEIYGIQERHFNYARAFPATVPACGPQHFTAKFKHKDWVDGEDVVQAGSTPGEDGFNLRFHRIETDLKDLGSDVAQAFACMEQMRRDLRALLDEIRVAINHLNQDVYRCCREKGSGYSIRDVGKTYTSGHRFMGVTRMGDVQVTLWDTAQGMMVLPAVQALSLDVLGDDRVKRPAAFARFVAERGDVRRRYAQGRVFKQDLVKEFGEERVPDGRTVRQLVEVLPERASFGSLLEMADAVADYEAAALRTTGGAGAAMAAILGIEAGRDRMGSARVEGLTSVPVDARTALTRAGFDTVEKLAGASIPTITMALWRQGLQGVRNGDAAEWRGIARVMTGLG